MKKIRKRCLQQGLAFLPALFSMNKNLFVKKRREFLQSLFKKEEKSSLMLGLKTKPFARLKNSGLKQVLFSLNKLQHPSFKSDFFLKMLGPSPFKKPLFVFCLGLFCTDCLLPSPFPSPSEVHQQSQAEQDKRNRGGRSRSTIKDKPCGENNECPDICEKIFERRTERDECEDHSVSEVKIFEKILDFFKGKDLSASATGANAEYFGNLSRINEEDLNDFISIAESPADLFDDTDDIFHEATFRNWIAENPPIAEIFRDRDDNFKMFKAIFGMTCASVNTALKSLGYVERKPNSAGFANTPSDEVAISAGNRDFLQWVHDYLRSESYTPPDPRDLINDSDLLPDDWCS